MRIALLTLEALANARAVRRFVAADPSRIALVALSDPFRAEAGGSIGQTVKRLRHSGPGILPYLFLNFSLPRVVGAIRSAPAGASPESVPLAVACRRLGIPCAPVADVNGPAFREALAACGADLLLTFHFDQILTADTIAATRLGGINVHPSLLPEHRGPVPTIHALNEDPVRLGVSVHRLAPRIDAGGLLAQVAVPDRRGLTAIGAASLLHEAALPLLETVLADLASSGGAAERQLPTLPYRGFPTPAELRALRGRRREAAGWRDVVAAFRTPI